MKPIAFAAFIALAHGATITTGIANDQQWVAASNWHSATRAAGTLIDPKTPQRLAAHKDVQPLLAGFVDPTLPPYQALGDGVADDAVALQAAIDDAYIARMTVVLPAGKVFMLSTQLRFIQPPNLTSHRSYGFAMVGGRPDAGKPRPVLRLKDFANTTGWVEMPHNGTEPWGGQGNCVPSDEDCTPKVFLFYQYLETRAGKLDPIRAETFFLARLRGVDVDVGNNPVVSAVSMNSAQLASIEDVRVTGTNFHAGFNGLPGSGGFSANLAVEGGDYGVVQNQFRPNPSITGLRLVGQRVAGVAVDVSKGPLVISGFTIEGPRNQTAAGGYRAVLLRNPANGSDNAFNAEDGLITLYGTGDGTAVETMGADVALKNIYLSGVKTIAVCVNAGLQLLSGGGAVRVPAYVLTASGGHISDRSKAPAYGKNGSATWLSAPLERRAQAVAPWAAGSLPLLHSWNYSVLPSWDSRQTLNVMTNYGATPSWMNDTDDDGARIQAAIDDACDPGASHSFGLPVFIPHGEYGIARPLDLRGGCAEVIGAGTHSTVLATLRGTAGGCWPDAGVTGGMLASLPRSASRTGALETSTAQASIALVSDFNLAAVDFCPFMDLRAGRLLLRDVGTAGQRGVIPPLRSADPSPSPSPGVVCRDEPFVALRGGVSGRFYGLPLDIADTRQCESSPQHVLLLIEGCQRGSGAIHLYQASTEHLINSYQTLINASHCGVHFHAWKYENALHSMSSNPPYGSGSLVKIQGSSDVSVFGGSGNYHMYNASVPIVDIVAESYNVSAMGMTRMQTRAEPKTGLLWLVDDGSEPPAAFGGYHVLLMYRDAGDLKGARSSATTK